MAECQADSRLHACRGTETVSPAWEGQTPGGVLTVMLPLMSALMGMNTGDPRQSRDRMRRDLHFLPGGIQDAAGCAFACLGVGENHL